MTGMRCDGCGQLLRYKSEIVAVYETDGALRAKLVREDSPGTGAADRLGATGKFHAGCGAEPSRPPRHDRLRSSVNALTIRHPARLKAVPAFAVRAGDAARFVRLGDRASDRAD